MTRTLRQWSPPGLLAIDLGQVSAEMWEWDDDDERPSVPGRIDVRGPLSETGWGATYSGIREQLAASVAAGIRPVVLVLDSPGGEVTGLRETVAAIEDTRKRCPVVAYVQGSACSAAYWLAAACDRIIAADTARVGCVGAVIAGLDLRGAYEQKGARYYRWTSARTPDKAPEPGSAAMDAEAQRTVDAVGDAFLSDLARLRGVADDLDAVADAYQRGASLPAAAALAAGWVDEVVTAGDTTHDWLLLGGDAPREYAYPMAARAAADVPGVPGDGGLMALDKPAGAAGPTDVVTLSRADHAALQERATAAEGREKELLAQLAEREAQGATLLTRVDAMEAQIKARDVADEIRAAEDAGKVVPPALRDMMGKLAADQRATILASIPVTRVQAPVGIPAAGQTPADAERAAGQAAIDAAKAKKERT